MLSGNEHRQPCGRVSYSVFAVLSGVRRGRTMGLARVLLLATLASSFAASAGGASEREGNSEERLIGWLGEVERPPASGSSSGSRSDATAGDASLAAATPQRRPWIEQISTAPRAYVWHGFLTPEECAHVIAAAEPLVERSGVIDSKTGAPAFDPIRTSYGAFLPIGYDEVISRIEQRAAEWAMIPVGHQEQLHVLRYDVGQQYKDHWDAFDAGVRDKIDFGNGRQRLATILMYLNDVEEGGETVFPHDTARWSETADRTGGNLGESGWSECASRGPAARPVKGDALLFYDLDLKGDFDKAALHAGCPVLRGTKWTATKWIHEMPFHNPKYMPPQCADATDTAAQCPGWAAAGECDANPEFMVGKGVAVGSCVASCCGGDGSGRVAMDLEKAGEATRSVCDLCQTKRREGASETNQSGK